MCIRDRSTCCYPIVRQIHFLWRKRGRNGAQCALHRPRCAQWGPYGQPGARNGCGRLKNARSCLWRAGLAETPRFPNSRQLISFEHKARTPHPPRPGARGPLGGWPWLRAAARGGAQVALCACTALVNMHEIHVTVSTVTSSRHLKPRRHPRAPPTK